MPSFLDICTIIGICVMAFIIVVMVIVYVINNRL
ncbi:hypothetical protein phiCTP1_gp82 [Clostridium phage phiCTP1]|nr:hypothetical protein phiCTP1_gp82 [Clostridium phage phiCTP1]ADL40383.1 hypothetical phage protein [Clostridium phage phiCTP1]